MKNLSYELGLISLSSLLVISYAQADDTQLEKVVISAHSFDQGQHEMAQPATLLTDEDLKRQRSTNLGETLAAQPGLNNSSYGSSVGRPVIRGMSGARVKVLQDGIDTLDASSVSPDHGVNVDLIGAKKIEVLRGPATLLYGSGAFGGVVNVVDERIPTGQDTENYGTEISAQYDSVSDGKTAAVKHSGHKDKIHWQLSASHHRSEDYELPKLKAHEEEHEEGETEEEHEEHESQDELANSDVAYSNNVTLGTSYVLDSGYVGIAFSQSKSEFGLPGHIHEEEHEEGETEEEHEEHEGDGARIKMRQQRFDIDSRFNNPIDNVEAVKFRLGFNDYKHDEIEGGEIGTKFRRQGFEGRTEALLSPMANIDQVVGLQVSQDTFKAIGDEAIVPETDTTVAGLFWLGKTQLNNWGLELGARLEQAQLSPDKPNAVSANCASSGVSTADYKDKDFFTRSLSAGVLRDFSLFADSESNWQFTTSLTSAQRAPTTQELFSCGAHAATQTYEIGNADLDSEQALNFEIGVRKVRGDFTAGINLYHNQISDYIYAQSTGKEVDGFGEYKFVQQDAGFIGGELDLSYIVTSGATLTAMADSVRGTLDKSQNGSDDLPRIPADRIGLGFELSTLALFSTNSDWLIFGQWQQVQKQKQTAANEESSEGYDLLSLGVSYQSVLASNEYRIDLKANNLLDEEVRNHTSFVKEQAPQPGRNISLGLAFAF